MKKSLVRVLAAVSLIGIVPLSSAADDLFVGVFESENRANFGSDIPGEYRIQVVALCSGKYSPDLVDKEGLKPGAPELFEPRHHKAKYYAHVSWFVYGFRKVER
jgi:hypothetical protein